MDLQLRGKTALVTGASAGIGRGIALALAAEGVRLAVTARRCDKLNQLADGVVAAGGTRPLVIEQDMMVGDAAARIAGAAIAGLGSVDILINNAGGSRSFTELHVGEAAWGEAMTLNFERPRQLGEALIDVMIAQGWGRIVNITGKSEPDHINGAFCAKAGMHSWAKGLSRMVGQPRHHGELHRAGAHPFRADPAQLHARVPAVAKPSTRSRWGATASRRRSPTSCAFSPARVRATSAAPSSRSMAACGAISFDSFIERLT